MSENHVSIVIPTLNEEGNVESLVKRLARVFRERSLRGELLFIDDHSTDATRERIASLAIEYADTFRIICHLKDGNRGKAQSLIKGFALAQFEVVAMIDADLQYPPEALPGMLDRLARGADIVVANRKEHDTNWLRRLLSKTFTLVFTRLLHDLHCDSQSGLKVFRKKILREVTLHPTPWTFDMEFLLSARNYGYVIDSVDITFAERQAGISKLNPLRALFEIGWSALRLKWQGHIPFVIKPENGDSMVGAGIAHNRQRFVTHTTLHHHISALRTFAPWQRNLIWGVFFFILIGLIISPLHTGILIVAILTAIYFIDALFNLFLVMKSLKTPPELSSTDEELAAIDEQALPVYSVLCPLYKEAHMLPTFVAAMQALDWPKNKLDVLLLLEENDPETIAAARAMDLPRYFRILVVPHSMPKTKPKACNYGLSFASGEYVVIYDAEDIPEPSQLKKAYLGFQNSHPSVRCLQAKLNYFNPHQNLLTRLFTAEYSLWFDVILPGLQSINTSIPLGGTSNHFRTRDLLELEGWDPFNVTEDCDLGARIFKRGFRTAIIDSVTLEEANSDVKNWIRQRSRWIKGYMQTYLVHMRYPVTFVRENGWHALIFQLVVGGKIGFMFINPFLWLATLSYFTLYIIVGPTLEALFPPLVFYFAALSLIFGNFLYLYYYMIGTAKREHFQVVKYVFLVPFYWFLVSWAAFIGLYQLIRKPHYWEKTLHGLHVKKAAKTEEKTIQQELVPESISVKSDFGFISWLMRAKQEIISRLPSFVPKMVYDFIFSSNGFFIGALVFSNFINFLFNAFIGRMLSFEDLALVTLINTLWFLAIVVVGAFSSTINHRSAYLSGAKGRGAVDAFFKKTMRQALWITIGVSLLWVLFTPFLSDFFQVDTVLTLLLFTPVFSFGIIMSGCRGLLQGLLHFSVVAGLFVAEAIIKLSIAGFLVVIGLHEWVYLSIPLSIALTAMLSYLAVRLIAKRSGSARQEISAAGSFPKSFFSSTIIFNLSIAIFLSADIFLVNHYLSPTMAGQYALLALIGKMIYFLGSLPNSFTITLVGRYEGLKLKTDKVLFLIYGLVLFTVVCGVLLLGIFGSFTAPLLFGEKAYSVIPWLLPYTFALGLFTLSGVVVSYHLAKRHYIFSLASMALSLIMVLGIVMFHGSVEYIVRVVFIVSISGWLILTWLHFYYRDLRFVWRAVRDFMGIFFNGFPRELPYLASGKKRILIFNWRDTKHKFAGGAEVYVHEIAKEWVKDGNHVTLFCGNDGQEKRYEIIDGIHIVRRGGFYLVYVWAFFYYMFRFRGKYDVIIDCENGIPFFTPLYVRKPIFCLLHHVHQDVFYHSLPRPFAWLASTLEKDIMPFFYGEVRFITVSESSRSEMESFGLGKKGIIVMHPGVDLATFSDILVERTPRPTVLYLGRLKGYKSVNVLIQAFRIVLSVRPEAKLIIAGSGEEESHLKRLVRELHLTSDQVHFTGQVNDKQKIELLQSSWMLVNPSFMEGWGIVAIEASACGTPVIASDVPGLRDSVRNEQTGYLVPYGDVKAFAEKIVLIIRDRELRDDMSVNAKEWAGNFDWLKTSRGFFAYINEHHD